MKRNSIIALLVAVTLVVIPMTVTAGGRQARGEGMGPGGGHGGGSLGPRMLLGRLGDHLELTDEQRQQLESIFETSGDQLKDLREQSHEARKAYRENTEPGQFNEEDVRNFAAGQNEFQTEIMVIKHRSKALVYNVLTPEQQEELQSLRDLLGPGESDGPHSGKRGGQSKGQRGWR